MDKMRIVRVDVNDEEHPLKMGEMFLDRITNTLYIGGQMNTSDIDFSNIFKLLKIYGTLSRQKRITSNIILTFHDNYIINGMLKTQQKIISEIGLNVTNDIIITGTLSKE